MPRTPSDRVGIKKSPSLASLGSSSSHSQLQRHASDFSEQVIRRISATTSVPITLPDRNYTLHNPCGCGLQHRARVVAGDIIRHPWFGPTTIVVILLNGVTMAVERPGEADPELEFVEQIFLLLFTLEMSLKLTAFGWGGYVRDRWNVLDFAVVLSGWAPLFLSSNANLSSMRLLRLLRIATLVRRVESMRHVVGVLFASVVQVRPTDRTLRSGSSFTCHLCIHFGMSSPRFAACGSHVPLHVLHVRVRIGWPAALLRAAALVRFVPRGHVARAFFLCLPRLALHPITGLQCLCTGGVCPKRTW